ncbi:MAG: HNH endonuclease signature motif containing protein [Cyanobacteria bacterium J06627_28]
MPLPKALIAQVRKRADYRCEYCRYPEILSTAPLSIDHIEPRSLGGTDEFHNLALACRRCNERRYNFVNAFDSVSGSKVPLFNPRTQLWSAHFIWSTDCLGIIGTTPVGRATCQRLDLNDSRRSDKFIQVSRQKWLQSGLLPPKDDPQQD